MTKSQSLSPFYFFAGLLCGLFIGVSLDKEWSSLVARLVSVSLFILLALFWRRFEAIARRHYMEGWGARKERGKRSFIFLEYALVRAVVVFLAVAGPALPKVDFTAITVAILMGCLVFAFGMFAYMGREVWVSCENENLVRALRSAAVQSRAVSN